LAVPVRGKRVEVVPEHALKIHGGVRGIAPLARRTNPVPRLTLNPHDSEFLEVALLNVLDHKQLHYYNWLHSATFISVFNQLHEQNLFHNKFYFMPLHVSSTCAHHQEVKIVYTASGIIAPIGVMIPEAVYTILTS